MYDLENLCFNNNFAQKWKLYNILHRLVHSTIPYRLFSSFHHKVSSPCKPPDPAQLPFGLASSHTRPPVSSPMLHCCLSPAFRPAAGLWPAVLPWTGLLVWLPDQTNFLLLTTSLICRVQSHSAGLLCLISHVGPLAWRPCCKNSRLESLFWSQCFFFSVCKLNKEFTKLHDLWVSLHPRRCNITRAGNVK